MRMPLLLWLYGLLSKKRLKAALLHLDFAYGEHIDQGQKYEILKNSLVHFLGMPFVWIRSLYWTEAEYLSMVKVSDESTRNLQAALAQGKGILLMGAHHGYWELGARYVCLKYPGRFNSVVKPLSPAWLNNMLVSGREAKGSKVIMKKGAARGVLTALKNQEIVCVLVDQNRPDGMAVELFGQLAMTTPIIPLMAMKTAAPVVSVVCLCTPDGYELKFGEPICFDGNAKNEDELHAAVLKCNQMLEEMILEAPEQYLWTHLRYKSRPAGHETLYDS